ncbi:MAG: SpoIIE family protein phosphatase [Verrucomicrobiaceae bacterium]|nr:SpoIIE family protein phosphatase [Verrucomicrobiaceae bacterium]
MSTLAIIFLVLFLVALAALFVVVTRRQKDSLTRLQAEEDAIIAEERRMFGYLHDLGEAISRTDSSAAVHQLIVEGAMRVTESKAGALYLADGDAGVLVPRHISDSCPPLVELNDQVVANARTNAFSLLSFLRLQTVVAGSGPVGRVFATQKPERLSDLLREGGFAGASHESQQQTTVMIGPLVSGNRKLGVLAVAANAGRRAYTQNDFEVFNSLAEQSAFALANAMAHQEAHAKKQIEAELRNASEIQRILLPEGDPALDGFVIAGKNIPARVLSGDYYDYIPLDASRFGVVIADVSGKGTAAALITAMCRSVLRSNAALSSSPAAVLAAVNRLLHPDIREDMFISMIYLVLDRATGEVSLARAGHTYPLLWRHRTNAVEEIKSGGLAVGIDRGDVFERVTKDCSFAMEPGDCLLLYTDGVNEATDSRGDEFGEERIKRTLAALAPQGARAVVSGLIDEVGSFLDGVRSHDDITLIALQKAA